MILNNWYTVGKKSFDFDLNLWIPYSWIMSLKKNGEKIFPIFVGEFEGRKIIFDNIEEFSETKGVLKAGGEEIKLGNMHKDMSQLEINILKGIPIVYDWYIDEELFLKGKVYKNGTFMNIKDEIVQQKGEMLFLKKNREVFVVWNCLSYQQKEYLINNFSDDERKKFCPDKFGSVENCVPDLWMLIKNKKEREERKRQWDEIDIPSWVTKY